MQQIDFPPLGRRVSHIGLGCGRLVGRATLRQSAAIVEAALELGITYFDVAPSYGLGTAEEVLGEVIAGSTDVVVATKVGVPRPEYSARADLVRRVVKPVLDRIPALKTRARRIYGTRTLPGAGRPRYDFSEAAVRRSLEESLRRLRRQSVDVYLAHEPHRLDLGPDLEACFQGLVKAGLIASFGTGVDARSDRWDRFGSIWQSGWPGEELSTYANDVTYVFHGVIRHAPRNRAGATIAPASELLRQAMDRAPQSLLLVSSSTPGRLRELMRSL